MPSKLANIWLPADRIHNAVSIEPVLFVLLLAFSSFLVYKLFLRGLSPERHRNLRSQFKNLMAHSAICAVFFGLFLVSRDLPDLVPNLFRLSPYFGLATVFWSYIVFIKTCRILIFEYLFFRSMTAGVPLLLVNIFTLALSVILAVWLLNTIFGFRLLPLVATSAVFSIVLGLALQDTLGNLFSGIALQLDKPYSIGDWVEIFNNGQKLTGLVTEITWRATVLLSTTEEIITIPNRIVSQSQVNNYAAKTGPIIRGQLFRIPYGTSIKKTKQVLLKSIENIRGIRKLPEPTVLVMESSESWITLKLIYYIDDFGRQFLINDDVL
ncbi:MAG: mechanosensitive ion channel family protein, partial [Deltaproteobacteria bacterium]